ncbi:MAG: hypothetical protein M1814_000976 [Vezdaea aestivalis]|nr:MAG: hypothetical protein M1814_000976 [Vezdaea aestivalis]
MKILTANFLTCAVKACKSSPDSFPLHFRDAELVKQEIDYNPAFLRNLMPRIDWDALKTTAGELGFTTLPETKPEFSELPAAGQKEEDEEAPSNEDVQMETAPTDTSEQDATLKELHTILLETQVQEGKMVCGHCGHEYLIKEGIANFLLPNHLVRAIGFQGRDQDNGAQGWMSEQKGQHGYMG